MKQARKGMKDVQSETDDRNIPLDKVGISDLSYPITVLDRNKNIQATVAKINMFVDLPHHYRGTHMSRFIEVISRHSMGMSLHSLDALLEDMRLTFDSEISHIEMEFPYFINKKAPVSGLESPMEYICRVEARKGARLELTVEVNVPAQNLCPCSKEISDYGAHNQRGNIKIRIRSNKLVWFEELIGIAENSASAPVFTLLKREDEKFVTEHAYDHPRFVEDTAREAALQLNNDPRIEWYSVEVKNVESIHNHNAYACVSKRVGK